MKISASLQTSRIVLPFAKDTSLPLTVICSGVFILSVLRLAIAFMPKYCVNCQIFADLQAYTSQLATAPQTPILTNTAAKS